MAKNVSDFGIFQIIAAGYPDYKIAFHNNTIMLNLFY
jgi:hypothetical protein